MSIGPITSLPIGTGVSPVLPGTSGPLNPANYSGPAKKASDPSEVARQFEAILVRQMLSESMKSMLEHGKDGQVYGYYISEAMADGITKGGGLGLRSILETQLRQQGPAQIAGAEAGVVQSQVPTPSGAKKL
ncbi:MAG: flagellar protein FlgJ [Verrucomicrobia bacterium]|nr:MAG: flagellar protein FlgJ [Verrucomicrobiota bacterium]